MITEITRLLEGYDVRCLQGSSPTRASKIQGNNRVVPDGTTHCDNLLPNPFPDVQRSSALVWGGDVLVWITRRVASS